jgi:hypothetical protein
MASMSRCIASARCGAGIRVRHTARDVEVMTVLRFHPGEIALSMGLKMTLMALLGAPPAAVPAFRTEPAR